MLFQLCNILHSDVFGQSAVSAWLHMWAGPANNAAMQSEGGSVVKSLCKNEQQKLKT